MSPCWRSTPPVPFPSVPSGCRLTPFLLALALTGLPVGASAQAMPGETALRAADPATPSTPPAEPAMPGPADDEALELPTDIERARAIWRRANERVAEFPRGHIDLLRWEARNPADRLPAPVGPVTGAVVMDMGEALRASLRHRPELFIRTDMNPIERSQVQVAYATHVRALQRAWLDAVTAQQSLRLKAESLEAASTGVELGRRMVQAGNWSQARLLREQRVEADARGAWTSAWLAQTVAMERLARLLGAWDAQAVNGLAQRLPAQLPEPPDLLVPGEGLGPADIEAAVLRRDTALALQRLKAGRELAAVSTGTLGVWSQALEDALRSQPSPRTAPQVGNTPLLRDHALERAARAESALLLAAAERRSMAREAWAQLRVRHAAALHAQQVVVRLQTALEQETLLRYNGMLQSSWDLLAGARERMDALDAALQAQRDFWSARADWDALLAGADYQSAGGPSAGGSPATAPQGH
jgi:hypothetical protein